MKVLHGNDLAEAVRSLFETDGLRCAVAFWGPEMAALARSRKVEVVLDISMNCTSRAALEALGVAEGMPADVVDRIGVLDGLHAKLYLGDDVAIVGSANASGNALGRSGGLPKLQEAGVLLGRQSDPEAFEQVESIWRHYLSLSRRIRPSDLDRAPLLPATRASRDDPPTTEDDAGSILEAVRLMPEAFARATFIFADHPADADEIEAGEDAYEEAHGARPRRDGRRHICSIDDGPELDRKLRPASQVFMWWFGSQPGLYAYHDPAWAEHDGSTSYFGRRGWSTVRRQLGIPLPSRGRAWEVDEAEARRLMKQDGRRKGKRFVVMNHDELFDALQVAAS
jgi:hypothetical protein